MGRKVTVKEYEGYEVPLWGNENILKLNGHDGCTLNEHFRRVNFVLYELYLNKAVTNKNKYNNCSHYTHVNVNRRISKHRSCTY